MNTINEFKEASELIYSHRKEIKNQMDDLSKNIYSALNQLNFSLKLITDTNNFTTKYVNSEVSILQLLTNALTTPNIETNINLYNNVAFNNLFASSVIFFENFSKMLMESVSNYLINADGVETKTLKSMHEDYCNYMFIQNDWALFKKDFQSMNVNYGSIFRIDPLDEETEMTDTQRTLLTQYIQYKTIFDSLYMIFITGDSVELPISTIVDEDSIERDLIPALQNVINFKNGSTLYDKYLDKLNVIIDETSSLFSRIYTYAGDLINYNKEYQPNFKDEDLYISTITEVCTISMDLLSTLVLKYPNRTTKQGLITDGDFNKILTTINNLLRREIEKATRLIDIVSKDYKFIKSLEAFITADKSFNSSELFKIMKNFDRDLNNTNIDNTVGLSNTANDDFKLSSLLRLYFDLTGNKADAFGDESFTSVLQDALALTDPLYDILNYYRLFLFPFSQDLALIFDFLETLYIFNTTLTNQEFNLAMSELFEIKINNIDHININTSKINESITSRYDTLNNLNYYNIEPFIKVIKDLDNLSTITTITQLTNLFNTIPTYNLILFSLIENILYNNIDIKLLLKTLSIKTNIRTTFFKIMFIIAINKIISTIEEHYTIPLIPESLTIHTTLTNSLPLIEETLTELSYLKLLISASDYYKGQGTIFNINRITNFNSLTADYIWDETKIDKIQTLFSLYKEV